MTNTDTVSGLQVFRRWGPDTILLDRVRGLFTFPDGEDRAAGYIFSAADGQGWPPGLADVGPVLLLELDWLLGVRFTVALFQAYRRGAGCGWHADDAFDEQAILSLGVTRTFGVRRPGGEPAWMPVGHGDLVFMPSGFQTGWQHCIRAEAVTGVRCSLVFRTVVRD